MLNLDETPQLPYIPLDLPENPSIQNPQVVDKRAEKAAYGLNGVIPFATIKNRIQQGDEDGVRREAALSVDQQNISEAKQMLLGNPTPQQLAAKFEKQNPATVFEDKYAAEFMNAFYSEPESGDFANAAKADPEGTAAVISIAKDLMARRELIHKRLVDATERQNQQSFISRAWDFGKDISGVTSLYTLRGNVPGTFFSGGLTGSNIEAQRFRLEGLPNKEFAVEFNRIMDHLIEANPSAAIQFADYFENPTSQKIFSDNAFSALDALIPVQVATSVGKSIFNIASRRAVRRMADTATSAAPIADGSSAPLSAVASSAAGQPLRSAKFRMADELASQLRGTEDPTQVMKNGILSVFQPLTTFAKTTADNLGADALNKLREAPSVVAQKIANLAQNTSKVIRTGDVLNTQVVVEKAAEEIANRYPGLTGNTINIMPIKYDVISNTFSADQIIGRNDGSFFSSLKEAKTFADFNNIPITHILGGPDILAGNARGAAIHTLKLPESQAKTIGEAALEVSQRAGPKKATWANKDVDLPVDILEEAPHKGPDGRMYQKVRYEGKDSYVPLDELKDIKTSGEIHPKSLRDMERLASKLPGVQVNTTKASNGMTVLESAGIDGQGKGYYIAINRPIIETAPFIRDSIMQTEKSLKSNKGWFNRLGVGWIRTPSEVLNEQDMTNRQLAVYAPAIWKQVLADVLKPAMDAKKQNSFFNRVFGKDSKFEFMLKDLQAEQKDFNTVEEINDYYQRKWGERPTEVEINGYFGLLQGRKVDYIMRNLAVYKNNFRLGGELHTIKLGDGEVSFNGIMQNHVPQSDYRVLIQGAGNKDNRVIQLDNLKFSKTGLAIIDGVTKGEWKLMRVIASEQKPFKDALNNTKYGDQAINWVLTRNVKTRPMEFKQLPERPGGHMEYPYDWYVKHPMMDVDAGGKETIYRYLGDTTAMAVDSRAMGQRVTKTLHEVQKFLKAGDEAAAEQSALNIPVPWAKLRELFLGKKAQFSLDQPFYVVPRGKTIADLPNHFESYNVPGTSKFSDIHKPGGSLNRQFQVEFTGERDAYDVMAMHDEGTTWNPHFAYRPADLVDPFTSINRSLSRIVDSTYMDDVKISSVESWLQRAKGLLDAKERDILSNPFATFYNTPLRKGVDDLKRQQLEAERYQIKAFAGIPSKLDTYLNELSHKMADSIHGSEGLKRGALIGSKWVYDTSRSVPDFLRAVTYHSSLGLFALPQFLVQLNTFVTIAGISGYGRAGQGTAGALLNLYSHLGASPEVMAKLGKISEKFGFKPGEWEEARTAMYNTGFPFVGRETNLTMAQSHMYPERMFSSGAYRVLDAGQIFFKGGEKMSRYGAWFTAWKEFRELNPTGRMTVQDINKVLNRADDLSGNMTKASKSLLQSGFGQFPTQFLGYQLRLFEQFTGKRLDWKQKLRLFATYAGIYGVPVASGIGALPLTDMIRSYALDHGYVEGEHLIPDTVMNGVPAMLLKAATGEMLNVGERYGAPGFDVVNDVLAGDKSFWSLFAGATGNNVYSFWKSKDPFIATFGSWIGGDNTFKLTGDDLIQPLKGVAAANIASRYYQALNTMQWISRNETTMATGVSPSMATLMSITGLQPLEADKFKLYNELQNSYKSYFDQGEHGYLMDFNRAVRALNQSVPDYSSASQHFRNAESYLVRYGYPEDRKPELVAKAWATTKESAPARERWNYWMQGKQTPSGQEATRQRTFGRIEQQLGNMK